MAQIIGQGMRRGVVDLTDLASQLAQSPAGQGLLAAGRLSAIAEMVASISPQINVSQLFGPDKLDFGKNSGLSEVFALQRSMAAVERASDSRTDR